MARTGDDSWDLASSVGATATLVAAGRAIASTDPRGLINDPFAAPLVRAVGIDFFTRMLDGQMDLSQFPNSSPERAQAMIDAMAVRTKFFDDYFTDSTAAGVRQAVILASGLDSRAFRLPWPDGTVVYELDQPDVIEFKTRTLAGIGAQPTATRRTIGIDLREDWPTALQDAGFDPAAPTAWLAEGLLIYLPPEAQDRLFDDLTALSAPGSTVATEYVPGIMSFDADKAREMSASRGFIARCGWRSTCRSVRRWRFCSSAVRSKRRNGFRRCCAVSSSVVSLSPSQTPARMYRRFERPPRARITAT